MRALAWFWAVLIVLAVAGAGYLQWHAPQVNVAHAAVPSQTASAPETTATPAASTAGLMAAVVPGGPVAAPDPALLEPSADFAGGFLPRIGPDHRSPAQVYAAPSDPSEQRPMVAILLAGIGMSESDSEQAILSTPPAISLAVSPYTVDPDPLLAQARERGHETFLSLPMEPRGYPLNDPGNRALLTGNSAATNAQMLAWAMTRFAGYAGVTGALGDLYGERFAESTGQMQPVLDDIARRGLSYVDPRPGAVVTPGVGRGIDLLIDEVPGASEIESSLGRLDQIALARGSALGLVSVPRPVALAQLATWASGLKERGIALVPVSAVLRAQAIRAQKAGP